MNSLSRARFLVASAGPVRSLRSVSILVQPQDKSNTHDQVKPFSDIPRPNKLKTMRAFMPGGEFYDASVSDYTSKLRERYGDIFMIPALFGFEEVLTVYNTKDIEMVFRNEGLWPRRSVFPSIEYFRNKVRPDVYGEIPGLIASHDEQWAKLRTAINPIFMQPKGLKVYYEPLSNINNEFIERIREIRDPKTLEVPENFMDEMNRAIFESLALVAFDRRMGLISNNKDNEDAQVLFQTTRDIFQLSYKLDFQPSIWKMVSTPTYRRMISVLNENLRVSQKLIQETQDELEKRRQAGEQVNSYSMLERMMEIDPKMAMIMSMDALLAGFDATSNLLAAVLLCLSNNPEKQLKLREEVLRVLPNKDGLLNEELMKDMPYLRAVIKESLRFYPNGPGTLRVCPKDVTLSGYNVPKGTNVLLSINSLTRDSTFYYQPNDFLPERWLRDPETGKKDKVNPFTYLPFGFGPRMCIGKRIVDLEMETTVSKLIRNFHVEFNRDSSKPFKNHFLQEAIISFPFKFTDIDK
ncbi:hypothetical protein KR009_009550 [Drosophila setifemur]|nr:hypothetical protein KR009_009550 [Drosophila setifemur]